MRVIKKLHLFVLKSFLPLFAMTFFIVLFIVLMQFLWRYIDDLVGKGLGMGVIAELFFYAAVSMVPMALPLAILLASLMTFGNLGERFELTAMKAAGISLLRVMAPLIILIGGIAVGAFFFQNNVLPKAQVKMWTLLFSMRQKSPEVEIPEKVFYDQIPGINLYVSHKGKKNGMLYDVKIYDVRRGGENVTILVSDSARMALTEDMQYIYLYMYAGNQYERMSPSTSMRNDPFRREAFDTKEILIPFDNNFNRLDEGGMREQYVGKNLAELQHTIDSVGHRVDSMGQVFTTTVAMQFGEKPDASQALSDSPSSPAAPVRGPAPRAAGKSENAQTPHIEWMGSLDSLINSLGSAEQSAIFAAAVRDVEYKRNSIMFDAETIAQEKKVIRRHGIELLKKFTLSVACLIFFFIGAPLGAIIRKGGIGAPLVISVLLFLVYYIIDNTGYKMARDGHAEVWLGMWLSTFVLAPLGIFVTYKAMTDSAVFDPDKINLFFRRLRGKREERNLLPKEVIIEEVSGEDAFVMLMRLDEFCDEVSQRLGRSKLLIGSKMVLMVKELDDDVDAVAEYLHNSRDPKVVALLNRLPILRPSRFMRKRTLSRDIASIKSVIAKLLGLQ